MNEPTIHLEPVTQVLDDGNAYFVGIPVRLPTYTPIYTKHIGMATKCAVGIAIKAVINSETGQPAAAVYVTDHHGVTIMSNVIHDVPMMDAHQTIVLN